MKQIIELNNQTFINNPINKTPIVINNSCFCEDLNFTFFKHGVGITLPANRATTVVFIITNKGFENIVNSGNSKLTTIGNKTKEAAIGAGTPLKKYLFNHDLHL